MTAESENEQNLWKAIQERRFSDARALIESGQVDTRVTDEHDLTALDYAQLSGDIEFFKFVSRKNRELNVKTVTERFPELCRNFLALPDFQMNFKWRVSSWIPFISAFCPKDEWKLTKVGSKLRIDTSLANWSGFRFTKGSLSIFFDAEQIGGNDANEGMLDSFIAVDHVSNERVSILREMISSAEFDADIENLMKMDLLKGTILVDRIQRKEAKGFLRRKVKPVVHDGHFQANPYDFTNIKVKFMHFFCEDFGKTSKKQMNNNTNENNNNNNNNNNNDNNNNIDNDNNDDEVKPQFHEKTYSGRFWCSQDFPVQPNSLIPFLEALAPFKETAKNVVDVLSLFDVGTPIKAEVYVFPTVKLDFQFCNYSGDVDAYREYVKLPPLPSKYQEENEAVDS